MFGVALCLVLLCFGNSQGIAISKLTASDAHQDLITSLPGLYFPTNYRQYSGYLQADNDTFFHYWFVESQNKPAEDPLLLWLNGGPGCSSLDGLLNELGPYHISNNGSLYNNPDTWNSFANILYIESPACVGFSINTKGDCSASDDSTSLRNHNALRSFFDKFPSYIKNPFFVTGESYGGIYVPTLSVRIVENMDTLPLNFQGFAVGNGMSSYKMNDDSLIFFANYHGLLGQILWTDLVNHCCDSDIPTKDTCHFSESMWPVCRDRVATATKIAFDSGLNMYNLYADCEQPGQQAGLHSSPATSLSRYHADAANLFIHYKQNNDVLPNLTLDPPCTNSVAMSNFLNNPSVRDAIHVSTKSGPWEVCSDQVNNQYNRQYYDMSTHYKKLQVAGIRGLVYNGDVDMACNFIGDQWFVEALGFKETASRRMWRSGGQVGGFVKRFEKLDLLTVRGSGHMVPQDKPGPSLHMIRSFVENTPY